jgi:hypothetical protein
VCLPAASQIPVFDAPNQVHFLATVDTLRAELGQVQSLVSAVSGLRDMRRLPNPLTASMQTLSGIQPIESPLASALGGVAGPPCVARNADSLATCRLDATKTPSEQAATSQLFVQQTSQESTLGLLETDLATSTDLKASADLSARAALVNASVGSERLGVELFALQSTLQNEAIMKARRADQLERLMTSSRAVDSLGVAPFGTSL